MVPSILPTCLLLATSAPQDSAHLVDAMIARSNELRSFVATYKVYSRSDDAEGKWSEMNLRIVYRAPDELRAEFESEDSRTLSVIAGGRISMLVEKDDRAVQHGEADLEASAVEERTRIRQAFREKFPALGELDEASSLGPYVSFQWKSGTESERPRSTLQLGTGRGGDPLLDWLGRLKRSSAQLSVESEDVVWDLAEDCRVLLLKDSGFIHKVVSTYGGKTKVVFELEDLDLDAEVGDEEFRFPSVDASATDTSEPMGKSLGLTQLMTLRSSIHRKIGDAVEAGTLDWNSDTRVGLGAVLRTFHSEFAPFYCVEAIRQSRAAVDKYGLWDQERRQSFPKDASKEEIARGEAALEEKLVGWEAKFRDNLEQVVETYLARGVPESSGKNASKVSIESRALELEVAESACRKSVVEPVLEYFKQQMELARRGELPPAKH